MKLSGIILFILVGVFFTGCGSTKQIEVERKPLPAWYVAPPHSDNKTLYAIGEGKSKEEALVNALNNLLATLSVSVSSEYNSKSVVKEGTHKSATVDATYENEVHAKVKEVRITNYEVLQAKKLGFKRYATLVKVDKMVLFHSLKNDVDQKFTMFESMEKNTKFHPLKQLNVYNDFYQDIGLIENSLSVMSALNPNFNQKPYIEKIAAFKKRRLDLLGSISFAIHPKRNAKNLVPPIKKGLTQKHFHIKHTRDQYHFDVYISLKTAYAHSYGFYLARGVITLVTKDYLGVTIGSNTYNITGQSSQSKEIAQQDIAKKFKELIEKEGIIKILGLPLK